MIARSRVPATLRALSHDAGSTLLAVGLLGLALGTVAAAFSILYATVLAPFPFPDQHQLALIWRTDRRAGVPVIEMSYRDAIDLRPLSRTFSDLASFGSINWDLAIVEPGPRTTVQAAGVSGRFFPALQTQALLGRTLGPIDDAPGAPLTLVLSHALWVQRFGSDPAIIGRTIRVGGDKGPQPAIVVGVMPHAFDFPRGAAAWVPLVPWLGPNHEGITNRGLNAFYWLGRLRPGVTADEGQRELARLIPQVNPVHLGNPTPVVTPIVEYLLGPSRAAVWAIFSLATLVWLLASTNVAGLLLVQWSRRRHEMAIRRALGAGTRRIVVQWLLQSAAITIGSAIVAVVIAEAARRVTIALAGSTVPRLQDATLGVPVLIFGAMMSAGAVLIAGGLPAWHAARATPMDALRLHAGRTRSRAQAWLVAVELFVAIVALAMAGRLVRAVLDLDRLDFGFQPQGVLTMDIRSSGDWTRFQQTLLPRVRALAGVVAAGSVSVRPLRYSAIGLDTSIMFEGQSLDDKAALNANPVLNDEAVTPGYFAAAGIATLRGRVFDETDDRADGPSVIVLGERAAALLWPGQDPIGKRLLLGEFAQQRDANGQLRWSTVVGVVKDVHYRGINDVRLDVYVPMTQSTQGVKQLLVRATGDPLALVEPIRRVAHAIDAGATIEETATLPQIVYDATRVWRLTRTIAIAFGVLAMLIAGVGVYALLAQAVLARRYELAVRAALGARPLQLSRLVLRDAIVLASIASGVGLLAAVPATNLLARLDVSHSGVDVPALASVAALLFVAAFVASLVPAVRAAQAAPAAVLRRD